jgi:hypothetical protein
MQNLILTTTPNLEGKNIWRKLPVVLGLMQLLQ